MRGSPSRLCLTKRRATAGCTRCTSPRHVEIPLCNSVPPPETGPSCSFSPVWQGGRPSPASHSPPVPQRPPPGPCPGRAVLFACCMRQALWIERLSDDSCIPGSSCGWRDRISPHEGSRIEGYTSIYGNNRYQGGGSNLIRHRIRVAARGMLSDPIKLGFEAHGIP